MGSKPEKVARLIHFAHHQEGGKVLSLFDGVGFGALGAVRAKGRDVTCIDADKRQWELAYERVSFKLSDVLSKLPSA